MQKFFLIIKTFFSHSRSAQFSKQNTISKLLSMKANIFSNFFSFLAHKIPPKFFWDARIFFSSDIFLENGTIITVVKYILDHYNTIFWQYSFKTILETNFLNLLPLFSHKITSKKFWHFPRNWDNYCCNYWRTARLVIFLSTLQFWTCYISWFWFDAFSQLAKHFYFTSYSQYFWS